MIGGTGRTSRRWVALILAWGATVVVLAGWTPASAHAATLAVDLTINSVVLSGSRPTDRLTLKGRVTNTGDVPAYGVHVVLWRSRDPIKDLPTLAQASANHAGGWGSLLWAKPEHWVSVTDSTTALAPGASEAITLRATLDDLGFDTRGAVYAVGAQVLATDDMSSDYQVVGQSRTVVAVPAKGTVPVTSIVVLSAPPTKLVDNVFRNDALAAELRGRLNTLLTAAERPGMSWLIDPALLDEVRDLADGYRVGSGPKATDGTGSAVAAAWLARFEALDRHAGGRTLFANPDVNGARIAANHAVVPRANEAADDLAGIDDLPLVVVPGGETLSPSTYDFLADSGATAIVAGNASQAGALQAGTGEPLVLATSALPASGDAGPEAAAQNATALAAATIAGKAGVVRLLTDAAEVAADAAGLTDGMERRSLGDLLTSTPSRQVDLGPTKPARLSKAQFGAVERLADDFGTFAELAPATTLSDSADAALTRAVASAFIGGSQAFEAHLHGLADLVGEPAVRSSVVLDASPRFLMSSRSNEFPVTVTNNLAEAIRVKVVVTTDNPQRLTVPASEPFSVEPGQSVTVNIRPQASANGLVMAKAHVATESGERLTSDTSIVVEVTDLGVVAWIIVGVSAVVLVGATAWRIRQVRRRDAAQATAGPA